MKIKILLLTLIILISCEDKEIIRKEELVNYKNEIILTGNVYTYSKLSLFFEKEKNYESILPYSLIMAYKYNNADAYFDIYRITIKLNNDGVFDYKAITKIDPKTSKFAIDHLKISVDLGDITAKKYFAKYHEEGIFFKKNLELVKRINEEIKIR